MHLFWFFCIFSTVFALIKCNHLQRKNRYDYTVPTEVDCVTVRKEVIGTMTNSTCKPYYRHVPLKPMPSQEFQPSVVSVLRCDGNCPGHTCLPIQTRMIKVPVKLTTRDRYGKSNEMCALAEVEEHVQCRCRCQHRQTECNDKQHYVKDRCACVCTNQDYEKIKCEAKAGMTWDNEDCSCNCNQEDTECMTGQEWNHDQCQCT